MLSFQLRHVGLLSMCRCLSRFVKRRLGVDLDCTFITLLLEIEKAPTITRGESMQTLDRISQQPDVMGGKACIRGMRVTVGMIVSQVGAGHSVEEILKDYPYIEREDVMQALRYAAWRADEREIVLASARKFSLI